MTPAAALQAVRPDTPLTEALQLLAADDYHQLPIPEAGRSIGLLSRSAVMCFLQLRAQLGIEGGPARPAARDRPATTA